jgi:hypothetical protein
MQEIIDAAGVIEDAGFSLRRPMTDSAAAIFRPARIVPARRAASRVDPRPG